MTINEYKDVAQDESALLCAVAKQPVSVAIDGSALDFQLYSGVSSFCSLGFHGLQNLMEKVLKD